MRVYLFILSLVPLCFALLSVDEIQKRIDEAYVKEQEHVEAERLKFTNAILPALEKAIIEGKISTSFSSNATMRECDGQYGDIRPKEFCEWWKQRFNNTLCSYTNLVDYCPVTIRFSKK
jgi:hypothetical protein